MFVLAISIIAIWAATGHFYNYSDTWQLLINTGTTIVTFLMVFLIQNTQNRDAKALHIKLDELLRALDAARNEVIDVEEDTDESLEALREEFRQLKEAETTQAAACEPPAGEPRRPLGVSRQPDSRAA